MPRKYLSERKQFSRRNLAREGAGPEYIKDRDVTQEEQARRLRHQLFMLGSEDFCCYKFRGRTVQRAYPNNPPQQIEAHLRQSLPPEDKNISNEELSKRYAIVYIQHLDDFADEEPGSQARADKFDELAHLNNLTLEPVEPHEDFEARVGPMILARRRGNGFSTDGPRVPPPGWKTFARRFDDEE